jgi:N-acetylneuraminic acid mutarotase
MKTKSKIGAQIVRSAAWAGFGLLTLVALSSAFNSPNEGQKTGRPAVYNDRAKSPNQTRALSFAERVTFQRAIEEVYRHHRIWPKDNPDLKLSLDAPMTQAQLEKKVTDYLRNSQELENYRQRPLTKDQLQAEMNRMAQHTKQPEVLRELFEALGNDPFVIAECLARPVLADRLLARSATEQVRQTSGTYEHFVAATGDYTLPSISDQAGSIDEIWTRTNTTNAPTPRYNHTAVWTGTEMIVWGGDYYGDGSEVNTGGKYNPSTDSWTATSTTNAPHRRAWHTAVWTGREMIVWGGFVLDSSYHFLITGGRYNPATDTWIATSTSNAPTGRESHTAIWTGSEMIVWGGTNIWGFFFNTGGRYNPSTDSWTATSSTNAPAARDFHTAVWTGSQMIVWGGNDSTYQEVNTGGRYNPSTDSWTATSTTNAHPLLGTGTRQCGLTVR